MRRSSVANRYLNIQLFISKIICAPHSFVRIVINSFLLKIFIVVFLLRVALCPTHRFWKRIRLCKLLLPKLGIQRRVLSKQFIVCATLNNTATFKCQNFAVLDGAQSMSDRQSCSAFHKFVQCPLHELLAAFVESSGCLV